MPRTSMSLIALATATCLNGCFGLSAQDEIRLNTFKYNSKKFMEAEQFARAENACRKGLEMEPEDYSLNLALGYSLLRQGGAQRIPESVSTFERAVDVEPGFDVRCRLGLGEAQFQYGMLWSNQILYAEADERLTPEERAVAIAEAELNRDEAYGSAEEALLEALDSTDGRDNSAAQSTLARLYSILGRYEEAADVLRKMTSTLTNSIRVRRELDAESIPEERRELWARMLEQLEEQNVSGLGLLANVASKIERWEEVISVYARMEAEGWMQTADYFNRAQAYEALSARHAAIQDYETFYRQAAGKGSAFTDSVRVAMRRAAELRDGGDFLENS